MQTTVTVKLKLDVTAHVSELLSETQGQYVRALNLTSAVAYEKRCKNAVALHHLTYRDVREATALSANLVCSARAVVAEAYLVAVRQSPPRRRQARHRGGGCGGRLHQPHL